MPRLTQILKSVAKTINLAKPDVYQVPRKPPLNSLVFEKLPEPRCGDRIAINKPPTPTPVRVCTKEELQALYCCPCPCDCKEKIRLTKAQKLAKAFLLAAKLLVVGALVYYTWAEGLWSDSEHSQCILIKTVAKIFLVQQMIKYTWKEGLWSDAFHSSCFLSKFFEYCPPEMEMEENDFLDVSQMSLPEVEPCLPYIPRSDVVLYNLSHMWNSVVICVFWIILEGPIELLELICSIFRAKPPPPEEIDECQKIREKARSNIR